MAALRILPGKRQNSDGTHHHVSAKHLHRYVSEFDFRYNTRKEPDGVRTARAIRKSAGKRLKYRDSVAKDTESR